VKGRGEEGTKGKKKPNNPSEAKRPFNNGEPSQPSINFGTFGVRRVGKGVKKFRVSKKEVYDRSGQNRSPTRPARGKRRRRKRINQKGGNHGQRKVHPRGGVRTDHKNQKQHKTRTVRGGGGLRVLQGGEDGNIPITRKAENLDKKKKSWQRWQ